MKFEIGKYYQHSGGRTLHILCEIHTFFHGRTLLGEDACGSLSPIGTHEDAASNFHEVSGWPRSTYTGNGIPDPTEPSHPTMFDPLSESREYSVDDDGI